MSSRIPLSVLTSLCLAASTGVLASTVGMAAAGGPQPASSTMAGQTPLLSVAAFGAVGDGRTDDTKALQRAFDQAPAGALLQLPAGKVYLHSDVLHLRTRGLHLTGPGELRATREQRSSVWIEADDITIDGGLRLTMTGTTRRWDAWEQMRVRIKPVRGTVLRQIDVDGAAAAGIYVGGAGDFLLDRVTVSRTRADGIHLTGGAHDGQVVSPKVISSGDDGVAVVSYGQDGPPVARVSITSPSVLGTTWGRGVSVVGGTDITITDVDIERSSAAAVYVANEGAPWFSAAPHRVRVVGGELRQSNTDPRVDHGAVVVLAGARARPDDVVISDLDIRHTRTSARRSVGVITYGDAPVGVVLSDLRITGGPKSAYQGNTGTGYRLARWTVDGKAVPDAGDSRILLPKRPVVLPTPLASPPPAATPRTAPAPATSFRPTRVSRPVAPARTRHRSPFARLSRDHIAAHYHLRRP